MAGFILLICVVLLITCIIVISVSKYSDDGWGFATVITAVIILVMLIMIPASRIESKQKVQEIKAFEQTLLENRDTQQDLGTLERVSVIESINNCNKKIAAWKTKGNKWYNNKWYYHPSTKDIDYLK